MRYLVLKPPSYDRAAARRYPVLYFLHDGYGNERTLAARGVARELFARMGDGRLSEFLVIAPGGRGTWFSNSHDGTRRYEDFLTGDLLREVESRYRALPGKPARGITGISMGGYAAFKTALKHPEIFGAVSSLSGALIPIEWEALHRYSWIARRTLKQVFGSSPEDNSLAANDVWEILRSSRFSSPPFAAHLRGGTEDIYGLDGVAAQFGTYLTEHGIPATVVLEPGEHRWSYWKQALVAICEWHARQWRVLPPHPGLPAARFARSGVPDLRSQPAPEPGEGNAPSRTPAKGEGDGFSYDSP